jgi:hypothetical protein
MTADLTAQVMVRMEPAMLAALQADSDVNERTTAQTIRLAIRRYLGEAFALDPEPPPGLGSNTAGGSGSNGTANATVHEGTARRSRGAEPSAAAVPQT